MSDFLDIDTIRAGFTWSNIGWGIAAAQLVMFLRSKFVFNKYIAEDAVVSAVDKAAILTPVKCFVFAGSGNTIAASPFSTKLSMFCRLAGIPHEIHEADFSKAPKGRVPYIEHGGVIIGDSQLIIRYLENTFDIPALVKKAGTKFIPFSKQSKLDQSQSEMMRASLESTLYWCLNNTRWLGAGGAGKDEALWHATVKRYFSEIPFLIRSLFTSLIRVEVARNAWGQGLSRHSPNDQIYFAIRSIDALETALGRKAFLLGSSPTEVDCIAFGTFENYLDDSAWPNEVSTYIRDNCPGIVSYVDRVKTLVFADFEIGDKFPKSKL